MLLMSIIVSSIHRLFFFFNDPATTEIYTLHIVGSVRCVQETDISVHSLKGEMLSQDYKDFMKGLEFIVLLFSTEERMAQQISPTESLNQRALNIWFTTNREQNKRENSYIIECILKNHQ
eukprot:TRINITY_DN15188_c0_g1_i2.p3 TRINITY_DN15188_c0_g1~~TRINITY_DN15188_c0_g1_i2.p3  ORF type:complete len:120 (+),score=24.70 TRINITY_DN15188_c0_g1_i2:32-391(+)